MSEKSDFKAKILIVDDVMENIQVVGSVLADEGYDVFFAKSGKEALELVREQPLDLVLLDVMMPEMNGFQTAVEIKKDLKNKALPIIFLTALTEKEEVLQGFDAGAVDYVTKPFSRRELLARVKTHIALEKSRREVEEKNAALERIAQELSEANASRNKFFSILAHDLRNPFSGLIGLLDEIVRNFETFTSNELKDILLSLLSSSSHVYNLLLTLLDWGKAQTGGLVLKFEKVSLYKLLDEIVGAFENNFKQKKQSFKYNLEVSEVWADQATLAMVLRNLISNAIKFTPVSGQIQVLSRATAKGPLIQITDTGVGMKPEILSKLFRLDIKVSTPGTNQESGTGLGLILCKEFVEKNNATLEVHSRTGEGTTFSIQMPNQDGQKEEPSAIVPAKESR